MDTQQRAWPAVSSRYGHSSACGAHRHPRRHQAGVPQAGVRPVDVRILVYEARLDFDHQAAAGSMVARMSHVLTFTFADDTTVSTTLRGRPVRTLASDFFRFGIRDHDPVSEALAASAVQKAVAGAQFPAVWAALDRRRGGPFRRPHREPRRPALRVGGTAVATHLLAGIQPSLRTDAAARPRRSRDRFSGVA